MLDEKEITMDVIKGYVEVNNDVENETMKYLGEVCQYAHPKLCKASLTSKICDRRNCYYYHVAGTSRPLTDNFTCYNNESIPIHRQFNSKPIPLMQMDVPFLHNPISTLPQKVSHLPPKTHVPTPQVSIPQVPVNISPSNEFI